jgi:Do/DeqQ family serine protease
MKNQFGTLVLSALIGGVISVGVWQYAIELKPADELVDAATQVEIPVHRTINTNTVGNLDFTEASKMVMPSVVHIKSKVYGNRLRRNQYRIPDPFREFFGMPKQAPDENDDKLFDQGAGSGVIINANGYIVTNNHVIDGADEVEVSFNDSRTYTAEVVGTDPSTDLALLKVDETNLDYLEFSNSDQIEVGEWVLAVGNPFNLTSTVTSGIVSAKARNINILKDRYAIESFIQTDAAVNPGNSGGALVNTKGDLVGINTAIASNTGSFTGYSFAIPSNIVAKVVEDLLSYGMVQRAYLGVHIRELDAKLAEEKDIDIINGVYISDFSENSSAEQAGLEAGDVIVALDGKSTNKTPQLIAQVAQKRPGDHIDVKVYRDGRYKNFNIELKTRAGDTELVSKESRAVSDMLGVDFRQLTEEEKEEFGTEEGLVLDQIRGGIISNQTNIREGFILTRVDGKRVSSIKEVEKIIDGRDGGIMLEGFYPNSNRRHYYAIGLDS